MGPLEALTRTYEQRVAATLALPHLGIAGATRHSTTLASLPEANLVDEFDGRTKDRNVLCVELLHDGKLALVPLLAPCSHNTGSKLAKELILSGVHPLDIIVATEKDAGPPSPEKRNQKQERDWTFRNAVEWMWWLYTDQKALEAQEAADKTKVGN